MFKYVNRPLHANDLRRWIAVSIFWCSLSYYLKNSRVWFRWQSNTGDSQTYGRWWNWRFQRSCQNYYARNNTMFWVQHLAFPPTSEVSIMHACRNPKNSCPLYWIRPFDQMGWGIGAFILLWFLSPFFLWVDLQEYCIYRSKRERPLILMILIICSGFTQKYALVSLFLYSFITIICCTALTFNCVTFCRLSRELSSLVLMVLRIL